MRKCRERGRIKVVIIRVKGIGLDVVPVHQGFPGKKF
jgi:hypothetical protein